MSAPFVHTLYFEDLRVGMRETLMRTVMDEDVIGFARSRIDVSAAMPGGAGPAGSALRPRCAETRVTDTPAAAPVNHRNERRVSMKSP